MRLRGLHENRQWHIKGPEVPNRVAQLGQHLRLEQSSSNGQRIAHDIPAAKHHDIEHEVRERDRGRAVVLEQVERGSTFAVERDDLAIDDRVGRQPRQPLQHRGVSRAEVIAVAGLQGDPAVCREGDGSVSIEL